MEHILALLADFITQTVEVWGYAAIFILMFLESVFIPIPSEVTMPYAGFLVSQGKLSLWLVVLIGGVANLGGSLLGYWIGSKGDKKVHELIRKYGKFVLITNKEVEDAERWFKTHGEIIAFVSRLLPVVRTFISLPAGMSGMDIKKFSLYTLAGCLIWSYLLTYIGVALGNNWHSLEVHFRKFQYLIVAVFLVFGLWYLWHKINKIRHE